MQEVHKGQENEPEYPITGELLDEGTINELMKRFSFNPAPPGTNHINQRGENVVQAGKVIPKPAAE